MYKILVLSLVFIAPNYIISMRRAPMQRARPNPINLIRAHYSTPSKRNLTHEEKVKNMHAAIKASAKSDVGRSFFIKNLYQAIHEGYGRGRGVETNTFYNVIPPDFKKQLEATHLVITQASLKYCEELQNGKQNTHNNSYTEEFWDDAPAGRK